MMFSGEKDFRDKYKEWYKASGTRFSTRSYLEKALEKQHRDKLSLLIKNINALDEGITIKETYSSEKGMFESFGFTKLKNVPAFAVILTDGSTHAFEKAGFYGEALCLEMTALGIKSCWVSGSIKKQNLKDYINIEKGKKFLTSIAFGYGDDKSLKEVEAIRKRKTLDKIFEGEELSGSLKKIIECARNAPSAINRQPWKYELKDNMLYLKNPLVKGGPFPAELDIGISMLHVSAAASAHGISSVWEESKGYFGEFKL
jgi:nitroreductase